MNMTIKKEWYDVAEIMSDALQRAAFYEALTRYFFEGKEPEGKGEAALIFRLIKPEIDKDKQAKTKRKERTETKRTKTAPEKPKTKTTAAADEKQKVTPQRFQKPTIEEIKNYCDEKKYTNVDPAKFFNYYEANGWHVGRNPMKNWKASVTNWAHNGYNQGTGATIWGKENEVPEDYMNLI